MITVILFILGIDIEVLEGFGLVFFEDLFEVVVVLASENVLVLFDEVLGLDVEVLGFLLNFPLF
jgi:hypothetical protein